MRRTSLLALLCFVLAIGAHHHLYKSYSTKNPMFSQVLYLPTGQFLKPLSFGYEALVADFVYLWSIQYFTGHNARMEYLPAAYQIIIDLDPQYLDAYQTGALLLFYEGRSPKAALALLDQGLANNPDEWILPTDAGFYCSQDMKDYRLAAMYFKKASRIYDSPTLLKELLATMQYNIGNKEYSFRLWTEIYALTDRPSVKQAAFQHLHDLKVLIDLENLRKAIQVFYKENERYPLNLQQLPTKGLLKEIPVDPESNDYVYQADEGKVEYAGKLMMYRRYQ
jgi:tetratricopeptide (TPR) repeat protein